MTFEIYEKIFRKKASRSGFSEEDIQSCLLYAKPLLEKNVPIIYNTSNFASLVGYSKNYLKRAVLFTPYFYRRFSIKKKSGKLRELKEPLPSLKEIQIWILNNILYEILPSKFAKAYIPNRNIKDNVRFHRYKEKVLTLDIENFFSSIKKHRIEEIFKNIGYSSIVSSLLSKLCCCDEILPQGAPTSPYLSNIYLRNFDEVIGEYCLKNNIRFTRYADDLVFSGKFEEQPVIEIVVFELSKLDLVLNKEKIKIMGQNTRQIITGVVVNKTIQVPKVQRKFIRQEVFHIKKHGLTEHLSRTKNNRANYLKHLMGKINYVLFINPNDLEMSAYKTYLSENIS